MQPFCVTSVTAFGGYRVLVFWSCVRCNTCVLCRIWGWIVEERGFSWFVKPSFAVPSVSGSLELWPPPTTCSRPLRNVAGLYSAPNKSSCKWIRPQQRLDPESLVTLQVLSAILIGVKLPFQMPSTFWKRKINLVRFLPFVPVQARTQWNSTGVVNCSRRRNLLGSVSWDLNI